MPNQKKIIDSLPGIFILYMAFVILVYLQYRLRFFTWDDSYITFRHAQNMADGFGPVYNPGEMADGITNYLLALFLSFGIKFGVNPLHFAKWLGIISSWLVLILAFFFAKQRMRISPTFAGISAILIASSGMFAVESVGGLETSLFTLLILWILWEITAKKADELPDSKLALAGIASGIAMLTRPDAALFIVAIILLLIDKKNLKGSIRRISVFLLPVLIIYLPYFIKHWITFGYPFPNSYYAKKLATGNLLIRGFSRLKTNLMDIGVIWLVFSIAILGMIRTSTGAVREKFEHKHIVIALLVFVIARFVFIVLSGGPWMGWGRFMVPILPELYLLIAGIFYLVWKENHKVLWVRGVVLLFVLATVFLNFQYSKKNLFREATPSLHLDRIHIPLGIALGDVLTSDESICFVDAGALPYYSDLINIDPAGLCDRHIAHLPGEFDIKTDPAYILDRKPTVIILNSIDPPPNFNPQSPIDKTMISFPRLTKEYDLAFAVEAWSNYNLWLFIRKDRVEDVKDSLTKHPKLIHIFGG